ncbi:MAG: FAD-dependent oxidoreductase [Candidatus Lokiarchaeota archaeon]|nr:FAD-dependent oxidoreductase [Candidatus Lokiarchaeota archaeon]
MADISYTKKIKIKYKADLAVFGGGIAGIGTACAAAKKGYTVVLVERLGWLGGNGTSGGVRGFCGETSKQGKIFDEIIEHLENLEAIEPHFYARDVFFKGRKYEHQYLVVVLDKIVQKYNIKLLIHTRFIDVIRKNRTIEYAIIAEQEGICGIKAKYYVDCTGEACCCQSAGCEMVKGREEDGLQLPMSVIGFYRRTPLFKKPRSVSDSYFNRNPIHNASDKPMTSFNSCGKYSKGVKIKIPKFDSTISNDLTQAEIEGRSELMRVLHYYQKKKYKKWELDHLSPIIGIREGSRIKGEYYLKVDDCRKGRSFKDGIAVGHYPLDAHDPTDNKRTYILDKKELRVPPYDIPFRSLIPKNIDNLLVAGRNLSADQLALSSARVMTTCCSMGQAVALGIDLCLKYEMNPIEIATYKPEELQKSVKESGICLDHEFYKPR